jgi:NTE family protein
VENELAALRLPREPVREGTRRAIVLSGGGARGAYEVGVLRFVFERLAPRLGFVPRFDLYCGTSVGAVHAAHLVAYADDPQAGIRALTEIWRAMSFATVYRFGMSDAFSFSRTLFGFMLGTPAPTEKQPARLHGLLNTTPLEQLVVKNIPWRRLRRNLYTRQAEALTVSATEIATGRTIVFVDNRDRRVPGWTHDTVVVATPARIGPEHALASAAIPFLFPAVRVGGRYFCDGGLRQITPLTPALRLGANRVMVIGLRSRTPDDDSPELRAERERQFLSASFLFGKVLDAFLLDPVDYDLARMRVLNQVLRAGVEQYGSSYLDKINQVVIRERGLGFQVVEDCFVKPSQNIGTIAAHHVARLRRRPAKTWIGGFAFRSLTSGSPEDEADLMSYLLFDGEYASELMELGMQDAERQEADLARFFTMP